MRAISVGLLTLGLTAFAGCASTWPLTGGTVVPAAEGYATSKTGDNGNTEVAVNVKHLAQPAKVAAGATVYVVWATPTDGGAATNVGAFLVDKDLNGRLETKTPLHTFQLTVTPEPSGTATSPSGPVVMAARITAK